MRATIHAQMPLVEQAIEHEHARELEMMSQVLDDEPEVLLLVQTDISKVGTDPDTGRPGMTAEQVLRAAVVKQIGRFSYEQLAFHLADSTTYRRFCRIGIADGTWSKSTLQRNIKCVRAETFEAINRLLVRRACAEGLENGEWVRIDCTVTATDIHQPTDSSLLWDCVRVLCRLMERGRALADVSFVDHRVAAKRRALAIQNAKTSDKRRRLYKALLKLAVDNIAQADAAAPILKRAGGSDAQDVLLAMGIAADLEHFAGLARRVVEQTQRRVLHGETVAAKDKLVSIFETHSSIIVKDRRETQYGHKVCLSSGRSGMTLDALVLDGNPADSTLAVPMVERHTDVFGAVPAKSAFDGGFASKANLAVIKGLGVRDVAFNKRRGLAVLDMVKSSWVYRQMYRFRAGIEGVISRLKRCFGLDRCRWRGWKSFGAYVWSSIVSVNLLIMARYLLL